MMPREGTDRRVRPERRVIRRCALCQGELAFVATSAGLHLEWCRCWKEPVVSLHRYAGMGDHCAAFDDRPCDCGAVPRPKPAAHQGGCIAVDFDGTLAVYETWAQHGLTPGAPIGPMVERVKAWLAAGVEVRIFTARVSTRDEEERLQQEQIVRSWCERHLGQPLQVTAVKAFDIEQFWDDRAIQVEKNTGRVIERAAQEG